MRYAIPPTPSAEQLPGTKLANNALAGNLGEYIVSTVLSGSPVSLTTNVAANITSITLTPGDWSVEAIAYMLAANGASVSYLLASVSGTSAAAAAVVPYFNQGAPFTSNGNAVTLPIPGIRYSTPSNLTLYLVALSTFTATASAFGQIAARRVR